jgi:tetratricopeptide (TPR) repeat protein
MKQKLIVTLVAAAVAAACGGRSQRASDANAAEVAAVPETSSATSPPTSVVTGPVSFDEGQTAFTEKRYGDAVRLFTAYTSDKPDNVWGYYMLGLSAWKSGDRDAAANAFELALEKDASHVKSHINLSRVLIEQGKAQDALPHVEAVLAIDSTSGEAVRLLGRVKRELGDSAGAIAAYKRAIVLDERDVWSMNNLAKLYLGQGKYDEALGPLARAVEIDSTVPVFQNNLGLALAHSSKVDVGALAKTFEEEIKTWR